MAEVYESTTMNVTPMTNILVVITDNPMKPLQSIYELIDNSIDSFSRSKLMGIEIKNPLIDIKIPSLAEIKSDQGVLSVRDNAVGLSIEETQKAVTAGYSSKNRFDTLGLFGMGFNIATGKLGVETHFRTTKATDDFLIDVKINLKDMTRNNSYDIPCKKVEKAEGFVTGTIVEVSQWWEKGNPKRTHIEKLASMSDRAVCDAIGRVYATVLREGNIKIYVNGNRCVPYEPCVWSEERYVETKKYGSIYAKYSINNVLHIERRCVNCGALLNENETNCPECGSASIRTLEERLYGWVGIQRYLDRQEFGIDLIRNGRAICIGEKEAFFTWEDEAGRKTTEYPQENEGRGRIIGELHMDYMPVDYTKSDFVRTTAEWTRAIQFIRGNASLLPGKQGEIPNDSIMFKLYQGYHQMSTPGRKSLYIGQWSETQNRPVTFDKATMDEYIRGFKEKRPGYYEEKDWWALVEKADEKPIDNLEICPECGSQVFNEAEVCDTCGYILKGKICINPECGKRIQMSQMICEHCGTSQELDVEKEWRCEICGTKNSPLLDSCSKCGEKRGAKLHLSEEYLDGISEEDIKMSIDNCSVQLADGKYTENYKARVFVTSSRITPNGAKESLPYYTVNRIGEKKIYIDIKHPLFSTYGISPEYVVAYEMAMSIYENYPSLTVSYKEHAVSALVWKILESFYAGQLQTDEVAIKDNIRKMIRKIYERIGNFISEDIQQNLPNEIVQNIIKNLLNDNRADMISKVFTDGSCMTYLDERYIAEFFIAKPELFFDGIIFSEKYEQIEGVTVDLKYDMQKRLVRKYGNYMDSLVDFLEAKTLLPEELERAKLSFDIIQKRVVEDVR